MRKSDCGATVRVSAVKPTGCVRVPVYCGEHLEVVIELWDTGAVFTVLRMPMYKELLRWEYSRRSGPAWVAGLGGECEAYVAGGGGTGR